MGMTSWKGGVVRRTDAGIAKNFLSAEEIDGLNRLVVMFLDFAEDRARRRRQVFLRDWQDRLDDFLRFHERDVLRSAGMVSHEAAIDRAHSEFALFEGRRRQAAKDAAQAALDAQAMKDLDATQRSLAEARKRRTKPGAGKPPRKRRTGRDRDPTDPPT